jgi:hypothetical protein
MTKKQITILWHSLLLYLPFSLSMRCAVFALSIIIHNCTISRLLWRFDGRLQRRHSENSFRPQASQRTTKNVKRPAFSLSKQKHHFLQRRRRMIRSCIPESSISCSNSSLLSPTSRHLCRIRYQHQFEPVRSESQGPAPCRRNVQNITRPLSLSKTHHRALFGSAA